MDAQDEYEHETRVYWDALVDSMSVGGRSVVERSLARLSRHELEQLILTRLMDAAIDEVNNATPTTPE
ncbi:MULTISPECIES: hypothetical protein [unclassified Curtobacterium]|uniref:hypothetical protein n=1 Tax=unclassified Curtobacterium TaxID=257496 RepID=UPI003A7FFF9E